MQSVRSFLNESTDSGWRTVTEAAIGDLRAAFAAAHKNAKKEALAELERAERNVRYAKDLAVARTAFIERQGRQWTGKPKSPQR